MADRDQSVSDTLLTDQEQQTSSITKSDKLRTKVLAIIIVATIAVFVIVMVVSSSMASASVPPTRIKLTLLQNTTTIMKLGTSRVVDVLFFSGHDNRTQSDYQTVTEKTVHWRTFPQGIISVDPYGRVEALAVGTATLKVMSMYDFGIWDSKKIQVVQPKRMISTNKRIIDYSGEPRTAYRNGQRLVTRYLQEQIPNVPQIPEDLKKDSQDPQHAQKVTTVIDGDITWQILNYADGSNRNYLKRTDASVLQRDHQMYFIGQRYLTEDGQNIYKLRKDDNGHGIWLMSVSGNVNYIAMEEMSYSHKAEIMVNDTKKNVMRHGLASDAQLNNGKWQSKPSDNDGLWTGMYAAGELMKYSVLKKNKAPEDKINLARQDALKSLKAVLLVANVAGRNGTVDAKIRRYNCSFLEVFLSQDYLKKGKQYNVDSYPGSPADGVGYFGEDSGKIVDGAYQGGSKVYTYKAFRPEDWTTNEEPATTKRTLNGYFSRTFLIPALQGNKTTGGTWFKRNQDGTQTVLSGANMLYDYTLQDHPTFTLGNLDIPQLLADIQTIEGRPLKGSDFLYKGDTSTDSLIAHLFLYKVAFDILNDDDQQRKIKELVVDTMVALAQMFVNNGYSHVDATGQGTKWTRLNRDFLISDYTLEDSPLKAIQLLLIFKLCYYVTGDSQWQQEYQILVKHPSFRYVDLVASLWRRWVWKAFNQDPSPKDKRYRLEMKPEEVSEEQLVRHVMYSDHYSDDEEAMLAYYLAFQLEQDPELLQKYKEGINGYWQAIKYSENHLWYLIYQLTEPTNVSTSDGFGNKLIDTANWVLSRHPIDTTTYQAFVQGSRSDIIIEGILSVNPLQVIGVRKSQKDAIYANVTKNYQIAADFDPMNMYKIKPLPPDERSLHKFNGPTYTNIDRGSKNSKEAATLFTLPYWLGVYHNMIVYDP